MAGQGIQRCADVVVVAGVDRLGRTAAEGA
jgi:hypothetical protein